jgi:hypothetical protein
MSAHPRPVFGPPPHMETPPDMPVEYVNLARISHSPSELVLDFARMLPGAPTPQMAARLVMSPLGAKLFLRALAENLARFEAAFGEINIPGDPSLAEGLFHPPGQEPPPGE